MPKRSDKSENDDVATTRILTVEDDLYFLLEAFERLGRHLYGSSWDGHEFYSVPEAAHHSRNRERVTQLKEQVFGINAEIEKIENRQRKTLDSATLKALASVRSETVTRRAPLLEELAGLSVQPHDGGNVEGDRNERREKTLGMLLTGLANGQLKALRLPLAYIEPAEWRALSRYRVYLPLSWVRWFGSGAFNRRSVLFERGKFEDWRSTIAPIHGGDVRALPITVRARQIAKELVANASRPMKRQAFISELRAKFPGLSERESIKIWSEVALAFWKRSGPKSYTSAHAKPNFPA